jgi:hypothetical protein
VRLERDLIEEMEAYGMKKILKSICGTLPRPYRG